MHLHLLTASAAAALVAGTVSAGVTGNFARVDVLGGEVVMNAREIGGVFGNPPSDFTNSALSALHSDVQGSGVATDGFVTFLLAETDAGLSWVTLVDDENQPGDFQSADSVLGMSTTGPSTASLFVNNDADDISFRQDLGNGTFLAAGAFEWDGQREGDGFAWADLRAGDFAAFSFQEDNAALNSQPFQFLSWNGQMWEVVAQAGFSGNGQFAFTFTTVPAPGAIALLGLGALTQRRRRRA